MNSFVYKLLCIVCVIGACWYGAVQIMHKKQSQNIVVQNVQDNVQGDRHYCTDGKEDCDYNTDFFRDTWYAGEVDLDPMTHYNVDSDPVVLVEN
jgi:hypothetical protein